jgi:predicted N-formylglutamate amidohydrolase
MNSRSREQLLSTEDPPPFQILNPQGASPFLLIGDHAGNAVPAALGQLGLTENELARHIAWDIGVAGLGERLSATLDAVFVRQTYSRLVVDCNRDPQSPEAMPALSDGTVVPANQGLAPSDRAARVREIHEPYQAAIAAELARRDTAGRESVLVSLHSFTPAMQGIARPWQIGVLYSCGNTSFAMSVLRLLKAGGDLVVGDNEPYAMDGTDHTVPRHAFAARRPYVEIEIRQDLLASPEHQAEWSDRLATSFVPAVTESISSSA